MNELRLTLNKIKIGKKENEKTKSINRGINSLKI